MSTFNSNDLLQSQPTTTFSSLTIGLIVASSLFGVALLSLCIYLFRKRKTLDLLSSNEKITTTRIKNNQRKGWFLFINKKNNKINKNPKVITTLLDEIPLPPPTLPRSSMTKTNQQKSLQLPYHPYPISSSTIYSIPASSSMTAPSYYEEEGYDPKVLYYHHHHPTTTSSSITMVNKDKDDHHIRKCSEDIIKDPTLLQSLERQRHENDFYFKGTISSNIYRHPHPSSNSVFSHPIYSNDSSSFLSLPPSSHDQQQQQKQPGLYHIPTTSYQVW
ncbi:hypothetical protein BJ944DRAFT_289029 [Cunninghamella echinulata]|nr:hypothetical protein BJ944DRAFT_289029 [Cunninghamella echinulata]